MLANEDLLSKLEELRLDELKPLFEVTALLACDSSLLPRLEPVLLVLESRFDAPTVLASADDALESNDEPVLV